MTVRLFRFADTPARHASLFAVMAFAVATFAGGHDAFGQRNRAGPATTSGTAQQVANKEMQQELDAQWAKMTNEQRFLALTMSMRDNTDDPYLVSKMEEVAGAGYAEAQYMMGIVCRDGLGGRAKDMQQSHAWFLLVAQHTAQDLPECWAADASCTRASFTVGENYYFGNPGVPKNPSEGFKWFLKSAEAGYAPAQFNVSLLYMDGKVVGKDIQSHVEWMKRAAANGHEKAEEVIDTYRAKGLVD